MGQHLAKLMSGTGVTAVCRWRRRHDPVIVMYHGVIPDEQWQDWETADMVPLSAFRRQLAFFAKHYNVVSLKSVANWLTTPGAPLPGRALVITFDDGYLNNARYAVPALKEFGFPAAFYLTTGFLDRTADLWWLLLKQYLALCQRDGREARVDPFGEVDVDSRHGAGESYHSLLSRIKGLPAAERLAVVAYLKDQLAGTSPPFEEVYAPMDWDDARRMHDDGFELGAHTVTHPILSGQSHDESQWEITESVRRIREEVPALADISFSYPNGQRADFTSAHEAAARDAGCFAALAGFWGANTDQQHLHQLRRVCLAGYHTPAGVEWSVCGLRQAIRLALGRSAD